MATRQKLGTSSPYFAHSRLALAGTRPVSGRLGHLGYMDIDNAHREGIEPVLSISELAARLRVSVQTIYDLRSQGRGPRGFRVGREIRFRLSEVDSWLARMEEADAERHASRGSDR